MLAAPQVWQYKTRKQPHRREEVPSMKQQAARIQTLNRKA